METTSSTAEPERGIDARIASPLRVSRSLERLGV
jgi:hypothetical protein